MVQVMVHTIAVDSTGQPVLLLKPVHDEPATGRTVTDHPATDDFVTDHTGSEPGAAEPGAVQPREVQSGSDRPGARRPIPDEPHQGLLLPIWVGPLEAAAILVALEVSDAPPRPMPYDLMAALVDAGGVRLDRVEVTRLHAGTFYATLTLTTADGVRELDARPSDSIALAVRVKAPIFVADEVLEAAGIPAAALGDASEETEDEVAAFQEFLDQVDPDDFRG